MSAVPIFKKKILGDKEYAKMIGKYVNDQYI